MRNIVSLFMYFFFFILFVGCGKKNTIESLPSEKVSLFTSTNKDIEKSYLWARNMAFSYVHDDSDPVGYWYEAALPQREAFCMRDVSHQCIGAHILGLQLHNKNMMRRFVENISESRDWCSFWEINRYNKPAPVDYKNDNEFWYNLNANFDVMQACIRLYDWTSDKDYLQDNSFTSFYNHTVNDYVERWQLSADKIMQRPKIMNASSDFDPKNAFHTCRGLASYVENFSGLCVGVDLVSTIYAGYSSLSSAFRHLNNDSLSEYYKSEAEKYRSLLEEKWWNEELDCYNTFWTESKEFHRGEGVPHILWFNATENPLRIKASVDDILSRDWNVENMSAFPMIFYRLGYRDYALKYLTELPSMPRSEYPEVSFGIIEGVTSGLMGLVPSALNNEISTMSSLPDNSTEAFIENVPVFDGYVSLLHKGYHLSELHNNTGKSVMWNVAFIGDYSYIKIDGKILRCSKRTNIFGDVISSVKILLPHGKKFIAEAIV